MNKQFTFDFPLTINGEHDEVIRSLLKIAAKDLHDAFLVKGLIAICLGGSLGRGEGSVAVLDGTPCMLSDFDFTLVVDDKESAHEISKSLPSLLRRLNSRLSGRGFKSYVDCGVVTIKALNSEQHSLFWFEFCKTAKIVFSSEPFFTLPINNNVDLLEALILLNNRIIEQLKYLEFGKGFDAAIYINHEMEIYLCARTYSDLGKALLLYHNHYTVNFLEKIENLELLVIEEKIQASLLERIKFWTSFKLNPEMGSVICKYRVNGIKECIPIIKKELANDIIALWKAIASEVFCCKRHDSLIVLVSKVRVRPLYRTFRSWAAFLIKGNKNNLGEKIVPTFKAFENLYRIPPVWLSYLPGILFYASVVAELLDFQEVELHIKKYIPEPLNSNDYSIAFRQEYYKGKITELWDYLAMGGRHIKKEEEQLIEIT